MPAVQGLCLSNKFSIFLKLNFEENYAKNILAGSTLLSFLIYTVYIVYEQEADF